MKQAATLLMVRDGVDGVEVLMVKRSDQLFGGGWWVFPGGSLDDDDRDPTNLALIEGLNGRDDGPWMLAALRETVEEVGLVLGEADGVDRDAVLASMRANGGQFDVGGLHAISQWRPPEVISRRYDTRFYVAAWEGTAEPTPNPDEVVAWEWVDPRDALERPPEEFPLVLPTRYHLELLARFGSAEHVLRFAEDIDVFVVEPEPIEVDGVTHLTFTGPDGEQVIRSIMGS